MHHANILIIDDEESMRLACIQTLEDAGHRAQAAESGFQALEKIDKESFDVVILDLMMPGISGMEILKKIKEKYQSLGVIVITGYASIESAVEAMKTGADDYITKPFTPDTLISVVGNYIQSTRLSLEKTCTQLALDDKKISETIIGRSEAITKTIQLVKKVAPIDSTVLITGETGSGKELVARTIHALSSRHNKPFITVDCGSLVETLFESEMFGHTKGSFTGAMKTTIGKFELANHGTLFLDEISNLSVNMQARLLRVIQEREFSKVGSSEKILIDIRIISATNKDIEKEIQQGRFREDLYYRINVFPVRVPPLRERKEDISLLAEYFLKVLCSRNEIVAAPCLSKEAVRYLQSFDWPGNIRELKNVIERAVVTCDGGVITESDLSYSGVSGVRKDNAPDNGSLAGMERNEIIKALKQFNGHKIKTAEYLGINRKTLREKIKKYNIDITNDRAD